MLYLASPYSHHDPEVMHSRYLQALDAGAKLFTMGIYVFSPIAHCHDMINLHNMPRDFEYWKNYNFHMLDRAERFAILALPGWTDSKGMRGEIDYWESRPVKSLRPPVLLDPKYSDEWGVKLS